MKDIDCQTAQLEKMRHRARRGYTIYGSGLLAAVLLAFAVDIYCAAAAAAVVIALNLLVCRKDISEFHRVFREARICRKTRKYFREIKIKDQNLFTIDQVKSDSCLPLVSARGVVRVGLSGVLKNGIRAQIADVAFPIILNTKNGKQRNRILSGCYMRFDLKNSCGGGAVYISRNHSIYEILKNHYEMLGFHLHERQNYDIFVKEENAGFLYGIIKQIQALEDSCCGVVLMTSGRNTFLFLEKCYLETGDPDYKHPVTEQELDGSWFPQFDLVMDLIQTV